jgi:hypothetical protein
MNKTGTILGRLSKKEMRRIILYHPDEDIREKFLIFYDEYPKHPDQFGMKDLIVSQPIQVVDDDGNTQS